ARVFERFHRVEGARGRSFEGTGIGLALVQELVRHHGGDVRVASDVGRGTTFTVALPLGSAHLPPERIVPERPLEDARLPDSFLLEAKRWRDGTQPAEPAERAGGMHARPEAGRRILVADD